MQVLGPLMQYMYFLLLCSIACLSIYLLLGPQPWKGEGPIVFLKIIIIFMHYV